MQKVHCCATTRNTPAIRKAPRARFPPSASRARQSFCTISPEVDRMGWIQLGCWGATEQKSSIRIARACSCSPRFVRTSRHERSRFACFGRRNGAVIVAKFCVLRQSVIRENQGVCQSGFSRSSNAAPTAASMLSRRLSNWLATFTLMIRIGRLLTCVAEITTV